MLKRSSIEDRISTGAALLDEKAPGWEKRIDQDSLNIASGTDCVLGQMFGHYMNGKEALRLKKGAEFGFNRSWFSYGREYVLLNEGWKKLLAERRPSDA